ncbi:WRKY TRANSCRIPTION FACTOR 36-RELATED [Salix purpurea]|uniref:WRKY TRANSCRIPTION FACTOR 36-RELATED n=2 Tax=Salix purpurea TaxID=77065 RepID=A0A9Q0ZF65_SALPP|nr:WRKY TRANSCRIPTION FACTOR 36-RELATED [Salix purpurea]
MESSWVNTSLDLNINPFNHVNENPQVQKIKKLERYSTRVEQKVQVKNEDGVGVLVEELTRISGENKKLTEMLSAVCQNYIVLEKQLADLMSKNSEKELSTPLLSRKRTAGSEDYSNVINGIGGGNAESSSLDEESSKRPKENLKSKISTAYFRTSEFDPSLVVKDGYQWRKYGQKVTRDNPSPRAYFKCSSSPSCPVKKKVQKSAENPTILVATYEGEHNHASHSQQEPLPGSIHSSSFGQVFSTPTPIRSSDPTVTLDLIQSGTQVDTATMAARDVEVPAIQKILVQQMATSLTRDPNFTAALAAAISGRFNQTRIEKW